MDSAKTEKESKSFHSFMSSSESQFKKIKNTKAKLEWIDRFNGFLTAME